MKKVLSIILSVVFVFSTIVPVLAEDYSMTQVQNDEPSVGAKMVDVLLVRPPCLVGSIASTALFVVIAPIVFCLGVDQPTVRVMVEAPWRFTANRYPGEYDHYYDDKPITVVRPY